MYYYLECYLGTICIGPSLYYYNSDQDFNEKTQLVAQAQSSVRIQFVVDYKLSRKK